MFRTSSKFSIRLVLLAASLMICPGCHPWALWKHKGLQQLPVASAEHPVYEVICLWEPGEGTGLDGLPARGFIGQIMFFAQGISPPVRTKGDVRIYVFDDQGTLEEQQHPIHQFDFSEEAFDTFLTEANLGATYRLFIPYTRKGTHRANCSLRVRLTPKEGQPVYSKMGSLILPGPIKKPVNRSINEEIAHSLTKGDVQQASHEVPAKEDPLRVHTSPVPMPHSQTDVDADRARLFSVLSEVTGLPTPGKPQSIKQEAKAEPEKPTEESPQKSSSHSPSSNSPASNPLSEEAPPSIGRLKLAPAASHPLSGEKETTAENKSSGGNPPEKESVSQKDAAPVTAAELLESSSEAPGSDAGSATKGASPSQPESAPAIPAASPHPLSDLE